MKKLGIDLRGLQSGHEFRGIGMYMRSVVEEMFALGIDKKYKVIIYHYDSSNPLELIHLPEDAKFKRVLCKNPKKPDPYKPKWVKAKSYIAELVRNHYFWSPIPKTGSLDIFLQFDQHLGLPKNPFIKKILVVHDLIPLVYKEQYLPSALAAWKKYNWKVALRTAGSNYRYRLGLKQIFRADKILAISKNTKADLISLLKVKEKRILVVYNGGSHRPAANPPDLKKRTKFASSDLVSSIINTSKTKPYLLFVGGPEAPRRRLDHLITAYHHLRSAGHEVQLVLAGKELAGANSIPSPSTAKMFRQLSYKQDLHMLGFVNDKDINRLYKNALCFVFPSLYEGFGLPLVEAMQKGCPVVSYDNSSIPEVLDGAGLRIKPGVQPIIDAVYELIDKPASRKRMIKDGHRQAAKFSWEKTAQKVISTIDQL